MSNKLFSPEEVESLSKNRYVKKVSNKSIAYTDEFKQIFITENSAGKPPGIIFVECGFDIKLLGGERIRACGKRWRAIYKSGGVTRLQDTRKFNIGRPNEKNLSLEEKYERLEAKVKLLQAENELLKKLESLERRMRKKK